MREACERGNEAAGFHWGIWLGLGMGLAREMERGVEELKKTCRKGG